MPYYDKIIAASKIGDVFTFNASIASVEVFPDFDAYLSDGHRPRISRAGLQGTDEGDNLIRSFGRVDIASWRLAGSINTTLYTGMSFLEKSDVPIVNFRLNIKSLEDAPGRVTKAFAETRNPLESSQRLTKSNAADYMKGTWESADVRRKLNRRTSTVHGTNGTSSTIQWFYEEAKRGSPGGKFEPVDQGRFEISQVEKSSNGYSMVIILYSDSGNTTRWEFERRNRMECYESDGKRWGKN